MRECVQGTPSPPCYSGSGTLKPRRCTMCDEESLRYCKAYLRRRLAYGPPVERQGGETEAGAAGEQGVSGWGHLWPLGRHVQCEELRRVRKGSISPPVDGFVCDFFWRPVSLARRPGVSSHPNSKFKYAFVVLLAEAADDTHTAAAMYRTVGIDTSPKLTAPLRLPEEIQARPFRVRRSAAPAQAKKTLFKKLPVSARPDPQYVTVWTTVLSPRSPVSNVRRFRL